MKYSVLSFLSVLGWPHLLVKSQQFFQTWENTDIRMISTDFFDLAKKNWDELSSTCSPTPAVCCNDSAVAIPQTQGLTDTQVIKCDFSRKTNVECRQLAAVAFYNVCVGKVLAEMTHWPLQDLHLRQLSVESISNIFDIYDLRSGRLWLDPEQ